MSREIKPFGLRMPPELRELLKQHAELNRRSLNSEIVARLQTTLDPSERRSQSDATVQTHDVVVLSDAERALLNVFRSLLPDKQLALLSLF